MLLDEKNKTEHFLGNWYAATVAVDLFLEKVKARFTVVCINANMMNPNEVSYHQRGSWSGSFEDFDPHWQYIHLNAEVWLRAYHQFH